MIVSKGSERNLPKSKQMFFSVEFCNSLLLTLPSQYFGGRSEEREGRGRGGGGGYRRLEICINGCTGPDKSGCLCMYYNYHNVSGLYIV